MKMKATLICLFVMFAALTARSQDVITKTDRSEIKCKVTEVTDEFIKYKKFDMPDGPVYSIRRQEVWTIVYQNGEKEKYTDPVNSPQNPTVANNTSLVLQLVKKNKKIVTAFGPGDKIRFRYQTDGGDWWGSRSHHLFAARFYHHRRKAL
jgi:hypothetical protein